MTDANTPPATPPNPVAPPPAPPSTPWHEGKIDAEVIGYLTNKGLDPADPAKLALGLIPQYRNVEKLVGVKPEELVRWPKDIGDSDNWKNVHTRLGVPKEAKDYDLSAVKLKDGKDIDPAFADMIRASLHKANTPKDAAPAIAKDIVAFNEARAAADLAEVTAKIQTEKEALDKNWGTKREINMVIAKTALEKAGAASGLTPEQVKQGWDALTTVGGIGASAAMQMLFTFGSRMGESPFIGSDRIPGDPALMSREGAAAEIESLKKDTTFGAKLKAGDTDSKKKWENLHKVAFGQAA